MMQVKGLIFGLIAAAIGGIASEAVERGLNAANEKLQKRKNNIADDVEQDEEDDEDDES